jgi:hypothetical protein
MSRGAKNHGAGAKHMREQAGAHLAVRCETCGKVRFRNRKAARARAKKLYPGDHMSTYKCGEYWHIGHIPWAVRRGVRARDEGPTPPSVGQQEAG